MPQEKPKLLKLRKIDSKKEAKKKLVNKMLLKKPGLLKLQNKLKRVKE